MKPKALPPAAVLETVELCGEIRVVGAISSEEMEELERAHEAGDIRAEDKLRILQTGKRREQPASVLAAPSAGMRWDSPPTDPFEDIMRALGRR